MSSLSSIRKKLIIVGDGACGKTCLLLAFVKDEFMSEYHLTVFETYVSEIEVDSIKVLIEKNWLKSKLL